MKKKMALGIATIMAASCFQVTAFGANFSDIKDVPWDGAKTYINQVADAKLMVGDVHPVTGKLRFRAKEKVTYCEATQLAYSILQSTGKLKPADADLVKKWEHVLKSYNIPAWAYPSISYALENNITTLSEVSGFMTKKGNQIIGKNANREEVATIFGRALAPYYTINENPNLIFTDKGSISKDAVPYVDLLSTLGILVGDSEKNFSPKVLINRAEMAVLVLKTNDAAKGNITPTPQPQPEVSQEGMVQGTVASIEQYGSNKLLAINLQNGTRQGFMINETTYVLLKDASTQANISDLTVGDGVSVEYNGSAVKVIRFLVDKNLSAKEITGTVDDLTSSKIYVKKSDGKVEGFSLANTYTLKLDGSSSTMKILTEVYRDSIIKVTLKLDSSGFIIDIKATKEQDSGKMGELKAINDDEISYRESSSSKTTDYRWADNADVYLEGKESTISRVRSALKDDDLYVKIFLDSRDKVKKALVSKDKFDTKSTKDDFYGTVTSLSEGRISVKKTSNKSTEKFNFATSVSYYLDEESSNYRKVNAAYNKSYDNNDDFYVRVILDSNGEVKSLYASGKESKVKGNKYNSSKDGELYRINSSELRIDGKTYDMARDVDYYLEGKSSKLADVKDAFEYAQDRDREFYVTIYLDSDDRVIKVEASKSRNSKDRERNGEITEISKSKIKIKGESSWELDSSAKVKLDDEKISISNLTELVDDYDITIEATVKVKDDKVTDIEAFTKKAKGRLENLNYRDKTIKIKTGNGNRWEYKLESTNVNCTGSYDVVRELQIAFESDGKDFDVTLDFKDGEVKKIYNDRR